MKLSIRDIFSKNKFLMENLIFCALLNSKYVG